MSRIGKLHNWINIGKYLPSGIWIYEISSDITSCLNYKSKHTWWFYFDIINGNSCTTRIDLYPHRLNYTYENNVLKSIIFNHYKMGETTYYVKE